jgi:hypothetical protein
MNPTLREWMFAREVVRRLGFSPEEIFFAVYPSGILVDDAGIAHDLKRPVIGLELRRGELTFKWTISPIDMAADEIQAAYEAACNAWNDGGYPMAREEFITSRPYQMAVPLMQALMAKGFGLRNPDCN